MAEEQSQFSFDETQDGLELEVQYPPPILPLAIKESELMKRSPDGTFLYIDHRTPDIATVINTEKWQPATRNTKIKRNIPVNLIVSLIGGRHINGIIYHTPPRTPENSFDEEVANAASLLYREVETVKTKYKDTFHHHQGAIWVVEDKPSQGGDTSRKWRKQFMNNIGMVMSYDSEQTVEDEFTGKKQDILVSKPLHVIETDDYLITPGRREKKNMPVNIYQSKAGGYYKAVESAKREFADLAGHTIDDTEMRKEAAATHVPPETINEVGERAVFSKSLSNTYAQNTDRQGLTYDHSRSGSHNDSPPPNASQEWAAKKRDDEFSKLLVDPCGECGGQLHIAHSESWVYQGSIYRKETVICEGKHHDGYPKSRGKPRNKWVAKVVE